MNNVPAWVGIAVAVLILLGIALEGLGLVAFERLERRMSRKQRLAGTIGLLVFAIIVATRGLLHVLGR